jgi:hypothetical protein
MVKCVTRQKKKIMGIVISLIRDKIEDGIVCRDYITYASDEKCLKNFSGKNLNFLMPRCAIEYNIKRELEEQVLRL